MGETDELAELRETVARPDTTVRSYQADLTALQIAVKRHDDAVQAKKDTLAQRDVEIRAALRRRVPQMFICDETRLSREQVRKIGKGRSTP